MKIVLNYGKATIDLSVNWPGSIDLVKPASAMGVSDPLQTVTQALLHPLGNLSTKPISKDTRVAIAINDKTRPVPHKYLLPPLLNWLIKQGIAPDQINFFIATGTHAPMKQEEFPLILPDEILKTYRIFSHDCDAREGMKYLGVTHAGTEVSVNQDFRLSDLKIVVGNIEPHHFMGFSGGVKSAAIGLTARQTILQNHSHLVEPMSATGVYSGNPCREDVEEIGQLIGVDYALNAILNDQKEIVRVLWGDPVEVMKSGIQISTELTQVKVHHRYDCVIASAGGYPKDINLYQAQKALTNAAAICKDGGHVFLIAECKDGAGSQGFVEFLQRATNPQEVKELFAKEGFSLGPHKAFQIARIASRVQIHLLSAIPEPLVKQLLFHPINKIDLEKYLTDLPISSTLAWMPQGVAAIPYLEGE
jgi:nickel-dependent lactate racemase